MIRWRPVLLGALALTGAMVSIVIAVRPDFGPLFVVTGLVGGLVAGVTTADPADGWVDGGLAGLFGAPIFAVGYALVVLIAASVTGASVPTGPLFLEPFAGNPVLFVATFLFFGGPACAIPGALGGFLVGKGTS
ncbi:hypothetical protein [Natronorubrum texcoconense]|uniref:Uncharacterized protein n=1 Tax=Natronorubrum texcoconense TaxID=1095776 RepID=A0A1G9D9A7_9EURY|nr:hypothetical protein [Natronorubrum texcoconense]SDK60423.1 hypothetical protein SAMN04515672_3479 [Natronorubrum texcoconense]